MTKDQLNGILGGVYIKHLSNIVTYYNSNEHIYLYEYNTTKITFKNGVEKIKKTSFSKLKGINRGNQHTGTMSEEQLEEKTRKYLKEVKTNIINLAFNYNKWEYFITLTFDFRGVGEYTHDKAIDLLKKWINNQKHQNRCMTYLLVPEFHKESGHLHFHGLIANVPKWSFSEARYPLNYKIKSLRGKLIIKNGLQIYNLDNYKLGFTTISLIQDQEKVSNYISKYATKDLITLKNKKRYWYSRNLEKPITEYMYIEDSLTDYLEVDKLSYIKTFEKQACKIEIAQTKQLPIIDTMVK